MKEWLEILKGLMTPTIAIITVYIAWQQWKTNRQKYKADLYDRRLKIYQEVIRYLSIIVRDHTKMTLEDHFNFQRAIYEAYFLFGEDITKYIDEIYRRATGITHVDADPFPHNDLNWFGDQFTVARDKFKKYLDISK